MPVNNREFLYTFHWRGDCYHII